MGRITVRPDGKIDTDHPNNVDYIRKGKEISVEKKTDEKRNELKSTKKKKLNTDKNEMIDKDNSIIGSDFKLSGKPGAELEKLIEQVRTYKIKNEERLKTLIDRSIVDKCFGNMVSVIVNYFFPMGERMAPILAGKCSVNDPEIIADMKSMIDTEVSRCLKQFKKECKFNLKNI